MRGKKAAGAAIRKDRAELEARAVRAEHAESRLTGELADLKARTDREIHALRTAVSDARKERDEQVNPLLLAAEERIRSLSADLLKEKNEREFIESSYRKLCDGLMRAGFEEGLTRAQAVRRIANLSGEDFRVVPDATTQAVEQASDEDRSQAEAFAHAMHVKEHNATRRMLRAGGKLRASPVIIPVYDDPAPTP